MWMGRIGSKVTKAIHAACGRLSAFPGGDMTHGELLGVHAIMHRHPNMTDTDALKLARDEISAFVPLHRDISTMRGPDAT